MPVDQETGEMVAKHAHAIQHSIECVGGFKVRPDAVRNRGGNEGLE